MLANVNRAKGTKPFTPSMFAPSFFEAFIPTQAGELQQVGMSGIVNALDERS